MFLRSQYDVCMNVPISSSIDVQTSSSHVSQQSAEPQKSKKPMYIWVGITIVVVLEAALSVAYLRRGGLMPSAKSQALKGTQYVVTKDQPVGSDLYVETAAIEKPGWIVIFQGVELDDPKGHYLGSTKLLLAGKYSNTRIHLNPKTTGFVIDTLQSGSVLSVSIYYDTDGDGILNFDNDQIAQDTHGIPVVSRVTLL